MKHFNSYLAIGFTILAVMSLVVVETPSNVLAKEYPTLYRGIRPLGMGGAFTAVADDENAMFYNPAGLAETDELVGVDVTIPLPVPLIEVSTNSIDLYNDIQDTDMDDTGEVADLLRDYVGKHQHLRIGLFPNARFKIANVGAQIGALAQATVDMDIHNPVWPEVHADVVSDYGLLIGGGMKLPFAGLSAGAAIKMLTRNSLNEVYRATDIAGDDFGDKVNDDMKSGSGFSADLGLMYDIPYLSGYNPKVALVVQNVPNMDMGDAKEIKTQINGGLAVEKSFAGVTVIGALDYVDIGNGIGEDDDYPKRIHLGAEVQFPVILSVRLGLNQGYFTAGATIDVWIIRLNFATYAEEVGAHAGQRDDRRYAGQIVIAW